MINNYLTPKNQSLSKFNYLIILLVVAFNFSSNAQRMVCFEETDSVLYTNATNMQKVIIKFPENFDSNKSYPLLIALHGNGGTAKDMASVFIPFNNKEVIVAVPEGQYPRIINENIGFSWYYFTNNVQLSMLADNIVLEQVLGLIDNISNLYKIQDIFIMGFSQGASLAYTIGFKSPEKVVGIIAVGGSLPIIDARGSIVSSKEIVKAKDLKILLSRGNNDRLCKKKNFNEQKDFLTKKGLVTTSFEYQGGHFLTPDFLETVFIWITESSQTKQ